MEADGGDDFNAVDLWETNATKGAALLYYRPPAAAIDIPASGYVFNWKGNQTGDANILSSDVFRSVRRYWEAAEKQWVIEASECYEAKITCKDAGCLFYDTLVT